MAGKAAGIPRTYNVVDVDLALLRREVGKLKPRTISLDEILAGLADVMLAQSRAGVTANDIQVLLAKHDIVVSESRLRQHIRQLEKESGAGDSVLSPATGIDRQEITHVSPPPPPAAAD